MQYNKTVPSKPKKKKGRPKKARRKVMMSPRIRVISVEEVKLSSFHLLKNMAQC